MASPNVISMMLGKGAPYSMEELQQMGDRDCWKWVYQNKPPKKGDTRPQICFTGFTPEEREELETLADKAGYKVVKSITVKLKMLVTGEMPGPSKVKEAQEQGVKIINREKFVSEMKRADKKYEVQFKDGYAQGWKICIPECFKGSLKTKTFSVGDVFYDTPKAYEGAWVQALNHINLSIQVQSFKPDVIVYEVFKPNKDRTALARVATGTASADEFLRKLKEGFE